MRILIVTHYFPPETGAPQARLSALAAAWAAGGDDVTVLTGMPNHPTGVVPPEYRGAIRRRERRDGYRVIRTWLYATPREGTARKAIGHLSFMITSVLLGGRASGPADVVVVSSPSFFAIGSAWLLARLKRARLVVEVRDLWPAIFTELGVLTSRRVIRLLERLELAAYAAADTVVVVSDGFRANLIGRGVPSDKVHTIRNGVLPGEFDPDAAPDTQVRARLGAGPGDCLVLYAGTHGIAQGLTSVADAAARLTGEAIRFAFVGEGMDKRRLQRRVTELGLRNVTLLPGVPHEQVPALLAAADICLVPLRDVPLFSVVIPSKMFEYLAAGKPVVAAVTGEAAQILREAGASVVPPADSEALADAIRTLSADPQRRQAMGRQGRCYVERHFDRGTAGPAVPQAPGRARRPPMRPLVVGGSGLNSGSAGGIGSYVRTVVHLRPGQVAHRARLRTQQAVLRRFPEAGRLVLSGPAPSTAVGWPDTARPVDGLTSGRWPRLPELQAGKIRLLGLARELGNASDWEHADAPRLWRFHLHYWDWAWGLAADPDRLAARALFARLWRSWQASAEFGRGDAWHPYPTALRAWSWCGLHRDLAAGSDIEPDFVAGLAAHAGFLRRHLEYDLCGNHLIKDLKALVGLAVFFADERLLRLALRRLDRQLTRQVLADGGHYERSPAYHCQVLADLIDVADLLRASGRPPVGEITEAVERMRHWLGAVLAPDGQVPLLNDGYPVDRELLAALRPARPGAPASPLLVLPETGLVRAVAGGWHLLADVGPAVPAVTAGPRARRHARLPGACRRDSAADRYRHVDL